MLNKQTIFFRKIKKAFRQIVYLTREREKKERTKLIYFDFCIKRRKVETGNDIFFDISDNQKTTKNETKSGQSSVQFCSIDPIKY